ncbi:hypothetical protein BMS3Abin01_00432 [bacterium BMS3Abin01]|nr:hypothetical protein BMS3Abin01_00432 [bacterium BMS3Abin01]
MGLVWLANRLLGDPNAAMIWISVFASAAAVPAIYWLGKIMFSRAAGLVAALLLATSISFWGLSEVAFPYTILALLSTLSAILVYRTWQGEKRYILPTAVLLGLAAGFRQDLLPFMLPVFFVGLLGAGRRRVMAAAVALAAAVAAWYVPTSILTGGFSVYREASSQETAGILQDFSIFGKGWEALFHNAAALRHFLLLAIAGALPFLVYFLLRLAVPGAAALRRDRRLHFLALWFTPAALFYLLIHIGEPGYVFLILPPALLAASWGATLLADDLKKIASRRFLVRFAILLPVTAIGANLLFFLATDVSYGSRDLACGDQVFQSRLDTLKDNFNPDDTLIVAVYEFERVLYYLPRYRVWHFDPATVDEARTIIPDQVDNVVFFGDELELGGVSLMERLPVSDGRKLVFIDMHQVGAGKRILAVDWTNRRVAFS